MGNGLRIMRKTTALHLTRWHDDRITTDTAGQRERRCDGMTTFLGVLGVTLLFSVVYFLMLWASPKCPHCGKSHLRYKGEDESQREVWECPKCGEKMLI